MPSLAPNRLPDAAPAGATCWPDLSRRRWLRWGLASCGVLGLPALAQAAKAPSAAVPASSFYANFEAVQLTDQDGRRFKPSQLLGRFVLVNFVYTGCSTICPVQTRALVELQQQLPPTLRDRVHLLSVSLDPLHDTPQALKDFAQRMGADQSRWRFATGRPADIERLSEGLRLFRSEPAAKRPEDHSTALWLIDPNGQLRFRYAGNPPDVPRLLRELPALDALSRSAR